MNFATLPRHPPQPTDLPGIGGPDFDWFVFWFRLAQLVTLLAMVGIFVVLLLGVLFAVGGVRVGTFFA